MSTSALIPLRTRTSVATGMVFDIQRFSLHDGPGIRTTVFLKGCSLRCFWCQNPEGLQLSPQLQFIESYCTHCGACFDVCPNQAHQMVDGRHVIDRDACQLCGKCVAACPSEALRIAGRLLTVDQVMEVVRRDEPYYQTSGGGMTLSGGEPLTQPDFALALVKAAKERGLHTAIDTALNVPWSAVETVLPFTDLLLVDIKHMDAGRHLMVAHDTNELILANFDRLTEAGVPVIVRVPVIPGVNATPEDIAAIARFVAGRPNVQRLDLVPYHRLGESKRAGLGLPPSEALPYVSAEDMRRYRRIVADSGIAVSGPHAGSDDASAAPVAGDPSEWTFTGRLAELHATKLRHTEIKRRQQGPRDTDDWGQIPLTVESFAFRPQTDHPAGYILGPRDCGRNFRRFLNACPTYVDRHSSLLGGYFRLFSDYVTGWDPQCHWAHLVPDQRRYGIIHGIDNTQHFLSDVTIGLELGWEGLRAKIARYRAVNTGEEAQAYYGGLDDFVVGVQEWISNHVEAARRLAASEPRPECRRHLESMADLNQRIIKAPPATFREALQWLAWYQMAKRVYIGGGSLGRLDVILLPYYERDVANGNLTEEEAVFDLACFLLKDSHYIQLGGVDDEGRDSSNRLSFLFLEAAHRMRIPANIAVMVHDGMDPALLRRAVELLFVDRLGIPRFGGVRGVVDGCVRNGLPLRVARQRVQAGCNWYCLPGREYAFSDTIKINLAKVLLEALQDLLTDHATAPSVDRLWELFARHLGRAVDVTAAGIDWHMAHQHRFYPELALSLLCHGPIEKGVDASHGSLEYNHIGVDAAGLATVADSLAAIEHCIESERSVTWTELSYALGQNWWRAERIRRLLRAAPGFGRGDAIGDRWAVRVTRLFTDLVHAKPTRDGWRMTPGLFSWASTIPMGRETPATPDGRGAGEPISFGANPNPGRWHGGPLVTTGLCTAVSDVQPGYGNPAPLQLDVDLGSVSDEAGMANMTALIRTHFRLGGTLINTNVLDRDAVLEACRDPSKHPDLVVRVTGFSAYFASLSDEFRKLVYERVVAMQECAP